MNLGCCLYIPYVSLFYVTILYILKMMEVCTFINEHGHYYEGLRKAL
jgi:hypothetical protein